LEASELLSSHGIPMAKSFLCRTPDEAAEKANLLEFPVVMKILSPDILHKTDAGCVFLDLKSGEELETVFHKIMKNAKKYKPDARIDGVLIQEMAEKGLELIVGMKRDPQFGPLILFGSGGIFVEVYKDVAMRLLPIEKREAARMLREIKLYQVIAGSRGTVFDEEAILDALIKVSDLIAKHPEIEELDINPLFVYEKGKGVRGVDALVKVSS
jgi:acyl-CoA synthetase (NDP forming)